MSGHISRTPNSTGHVKSSAVKLVHEVMEACQCTKEEAIISLHHSQNDVEKAKRHRKLLKRYLRDEYPSRSVSREPWRAEIQARLTLGEQTDEETDAANLSDDEDSPNDEMSASGSAGIEFPFENEQNHHAANPRTSLMPTTSNMSREVDLAPSLGKATPVDREADSDCYLYHQKSKSDVTEGTHEETEGIRWDFNLPRVTVQSTLNAGLEHMEESFNLENVVGSLQHGASLEMIRNYFSRFDEETVQKNINNNVEGFPAMFYVVQSNNEPLLRLWVAYGGDPRVSHARSSIPLLAFAIINSDIIEEDTTLLTTTLLSLGATPDVIPPEFYTPYLRDLPENGPEDHRKVDGSDSATSKTRWCTDMARTKLAKTVTLSQRYYLEKASKTSKPSQRHIQLAQRRNAEALLGIPYFLVGQHLASNLLLQRLLSHLMVPSKRPLVLVFAGPSGHGKTELARKLGHLLSLEMEVVDCTIFNREIELFGPREPYVGSEKGSPLNNFLAKNTGNRCIVFLDEFEKTTSDIHKTLLLPFDNGEYQDRRHRTLVDCSKTIWILATNAHDTIIKEFYTANQEALCAEDNESERLSLMKSLSSVIKQDFLTRFESPITGRISAFIPFLPFTLGEQAVVVHKYLLELGTTVEGAVDLSHGPKEKLLGNIRLRIRRDASVCKLLAQLEYHSDLGARSLINAVDSVKNALVQTYLEVDEEIIERHQRSTCYIDVSDGEIEVKIVS